MTWRPEGRTPPARSDYAQPLRKPPELEAIEYLGGKAVVLLSGGIDSTVALAEFAPYREMHAVFVNYNQRHLCEYDSAVHQFEQWGAATFTNLRAALPVRSALTSHNLPIPNGHATAPDASYVPGRNAVLVALAAQIAESIGAKEVIFGANADDAAGYPDCRPAWVAAMGDVLQCHGLRLRAPHLHRTKRDVVRVAQVLGVDLAETWSCYQGSPAGPCGRCGACESREQALA